MIAPSFILPLIVKVIRLTTRGPRAFGAHNRGPCASAALHVILVEVGLLNYTLSLKK